MSRRLELYKWSEGLDVPYPYIAVGINNSVRHDPHWTCIAEGDEDYIRTLERVLMKEARREQAAD